jgi:histidyl-tRNA synthetase
MANNSKLSTESYKGVRDFYPDDMTMEKYIFDVWRSVAESFGYSEYGASILEPAELYRAKSGEEIVDNETYTFKDRGDREVTLRPEMTPTVARMVAAKRQELVFPLRWYSIPNLFRYEKPQRGRLREHWQLNVDIFGSDSVEADVEIISMSCAIMKKFGAKDDDFEIRINNRKILNDLFGHFNLSEEKTHKLSKILDKKSKISPDGFETAVEEIVGKKSATEFISAISSNQKLLETIGENNQNALDLISLIEKLSVVGITNVVFDPTLMRGFDYYTGVVFEVFDKHPDNNRSVFGGGRYDDLLDIFGAQKISAVGFGAGDVTTKDFLETHDLLPKIKTKTNLYIAAMSAEFINSAGLLATFLRDQGINVAIDFSDRKIGDKVKSAHRQNIPFVIVVGEDETKSGEYSVKNMKTGEEKKVKREEIAMVILEK